MTVYLKSALLSAVCATALVTGASGAEFNIPAGDLEGALNAYTSLTGVDLIVATKAIRGIRTRGAAGALSTDDALSRLLSGTGLRAQKQTSGAIAIIRGDTSSAEIVPLQIAQAAPVSRAVETVTVTSSKLGGADVQSIPISITALSQ
ncbi:MAG TPA: STN domain-containing protein, partial [Rhizomicrobium sp.]|nr:STN domain-containing protein [Rhizomicrobium sp.]